MAELKRAKKPLILRLFGFLGILVLLLFIAAVLGSFILIIGMSKKEVVLDSVRECISSHPTGVENHLTVKPDGSALIKLDKNDVWYFIDRELGENWQQELEEIAEKYGFSYSGCGLELKPHDSSVNFVVYRGFLRFAFSVLCHIDYAEGTVTVRPDKLKLLEIPIPLEPIEKLLGKKEPVEFSYRPELGFLSEITDISQGTDELVISGPMNKELISAGETDPDEITVLSFSRCSTSEAARAIGASDSYVGGELPEELQKLCTEPKAFADTLMKIMAMNGTDFAELQEKNHELMKRWFPEFSEKGGKDAAKEIEENYSRVLDILSRLAEKTAAEYIAKELHIKKGTLLYGKEAFSPKSFLGIGYDLYVQYLDVDSLRFCLCENPGAEFPSYPVLKTIVDSENSLPENADLMRAYFPGLLMTGEDGKGYLLLCCGGTSYRIIPVDEALFQIAAAQTIPLIDCGGLDQKAQS